MTVIDLTHLQIKLRHNFGRADILPANKAAELFANENGVIPGKKLRQLEEIGYKVEEV